MTIFTLRSIKKDFGIKELLTDASFSLDEGDKVGLIGTNGSGKSTLLKMIAGLESIDSGDRWVNPGSKIVYLPQQPDLDENHTVLEQVFADSGEQMALVREYEEISDRLSHGKGDTDKLMARLSAVSERIDEVDAWDLETKAKLILTKLGIEDFDAKIADLSGGYRKRIALATALLSEPDVLLMDEPTNHLDALSVEWLQNYLNGYRGALLLITHDRYFLDRVTNRILEIDRGDLYNYAGNYAYYLEKKALAEESAASSVRKHAGVLRRELEWLKRGPKARSTKQKARIDRIKDMRAQEFKRANGKVEIATAGRRIGKRVIEYLQSVAELVKTADGEIITASQMLEKFLFPPNQQYAPINKLSGGEKRRLFLLKVLMSAPNVLILDEPTNDLDVQTLAVLEDYLEDFNGCVIVVSHDRYFLDRTIDMVFALEPGGNLRLYPGNYSVYLDYKKAEEAKEIKGQKDKEKVTRTVESNNSKFTNSAQKAPKVSFNEKREYEQLESQIPKMEAEKEDIEKILSHNAPSGFAEMKKLSDRLAQLTQEIDRATERWLELAERVG